MTFEGQYLTYAEYQELGGSAIGLMPFNLLEFEARKQVDLRTQNRMLGIEEIPNEVKLCVYHLINKIENYNNSILSAGKSDGTISSENIDGYSVSYNQVNVTQIQEIIKSKQKELDDMIMNDLYGVAVNGVHLIYNGVV